MGVHPETAETARGLAVVHRRVRGSVCRQALLTPTIERRVDGNRKATFTGIWGVFRHRYGGEMSLLDVAHDAGGEDIRQLGAALVGWQTG